MTLVRAHESIRAGYSPSFSRARQLIVIGALMTGLTTIGCVPANNALIGGAGQPSPSAQQRVVVVSTAPNQASGAPPDSQPLESGNKRNSAVPDNLSEDADPPSMSRPGAPIAAARMLATGGSYARQKPGAGPGQTALTPTIPRTLPAESAETNRKVGGTAQTAQVGAIVPVPPAAPITSEARSERLPKLGSMIVPRASGAIIRDIGQNGAGYLRPDSISSSPSDGRSPVFVVAPDGSAQGQNGTRSPGPQNRTNAAATRGNPQNPPAIVGPAGSP